MMTLDTVDAISQWANTLTCELKDPGVSLSLPE